MPRIPRTEPSVGLNLQDQPTMSADALTGPGRALQGLGRAISGLSDVAEQMQQPSDQEKFDASMASMNAYDKASNYYLERTASITSDTDPTQWWNETSRGVNSIYDDAGANISNPKLRQSWDLSSTRFKNEFNLKGHARAIDLTTQRNVDGAATTFSTTISNLKANDPNFSQVLDTIDKQIGMIPGASEAQREQVRNAAAKAAYDKFIEGAATDPVSAVDSAQKVIDTWGKDLQAPAQKVGPQSSLSPSLVDGPQFTDRHGTTLKTITASNGARFTVNSNAAYRFAGLINDLQNAGVEIKGDQSGGYNYRNIAGSNRLSYHASGRAIDINWSENARGTKGKIDPELARSIAAKWGATWGGDWKNPDPMHFEIHDVSEGSDQKFASLFTGASQGGTAPGGEKTPAFKLSAYSPQAGGDSMEGGYAAAKPGPDGKAEVRTLADVQAGRSKYVTVAGNPKDYGKEFTIPEISYVDAKGQRKTLKNVQAIVHDTGSAFKDAPSGRYDIPIDRDATKKQMAASAGMWEKAGVQFVPKEQAPPVSQRGMTQYAGLSTGPADIGPAQNGATPANRIPNPPGNVQVADASGKVPPSAVPQESGAPAPAQPAADGVRAPNTIPVTDPKQAGGMTPQEYSNAAAEAQRNTTPGNLPGTEAAGGIDTSLMRPSIRTEVLKSLQKAMPTMLKARSDYLDSLVKRAEDVAGDGYLLPSDEHAKISSLVAKVGTEEQKQRLADAEVAAVYTSSRKAMRPEQLEADIATLSAQMAKNGGTPELKAKREAMQKLQTKMTKELQDNAVGWASAAGVIPPQMPVTPETFTVDTLNRRAEAAAETANRYGLQYRQFFSRDERGALEAQFNKGGDTMLQMMETMYQAFGKDTPLAVKEIAPKAPEAARAGYLLATGGDPQAVKDIASTIQRRQDPNYKEGNTKMDRAQMDAGAQDYFRDFYDAMPKQERDATLRTADAIYEARVKDPGVFDPELYKTALGEAVGERTNGNFKFGGVVQTKRGWFGGGDGGAIVLPSDVRQDTWKELFGEIGPDDLKAAGLPAPVDGKGRPISMTKALSGDLKSYGPGQYVIQLTNDAGQKGYVMQPTPDGKQTPFILDIGKLTPILRTRLPEMFWRQ